MDIFGCDNPIELTLGLTPPTVGSFDGYNPSTSPTIFIPSSAVVTYKAVNDGNISDEKWYEWEIDKIIIRHTLTYMAGSNGIITGISSQTVENTQSGSDGLKDNPRIDLNVTSDISVSAEFAKNNSRIYRSYTVINILVYTADKGGTITFDTNQGASNRVSRSEITAVPTEGYYFVKWSNGIKSMEPSITYIGQEIWQLIL